MKKLICILLSMMMVLGTGLAYAENSSYQKALFRLASLDILPVDLEEEAKITRADAAAAMVKLLIDDASWPGGDTGFIDVKSFDDFAGYVYYAKALGIVSGDGDDTFRPFDPLMMNELIKMAVNLLGYEEMAEQEGGYPSGYLSLALRQNLFKNVEAAADGSILAEGLVFMLDNLLKARPMEKKVGTGEYEISEDTLLDQILERRNTKNIKAIVTAVGEAVLADEQETLKDEISIDGVRYQYEADDKFDLLGKYVNAYYMEDRQSDRNVIADILVQDVNEEIIVDAEDIVSLDLTQLEYEDPVNPEKRTQRAKIAQDADFLYNKRLYTPESFDITSGQIRLLDSGGDGTYDTVFVDEYKSYIVDRVVLENQTVYFKEGETYQNKTGFKFDTDDEEKQYHLYDAEGNEMEFTDIAPDMVISLTSDVNQTINYATLSTNKVEGEVTLLDTDANEIAIDGQTYQLYRGKVRHIRSGKQAFSC